MTAATTVEIYRGLDGQWYWRVVAGNGHIIATAGEGFTRRWSAKRAARRVFGDVKPTVIE